jgi:hypothetical protein
VYSQENAHFFSEKVLPNYGYAEKGPKNGVLHHMCSPRIVSTLHVIFAELLQAR